MPCGRGWCKTWIAKSKMQERERARILLLVDFYGVGTLDAQSSLY